MTIEADNAPNLTDLRMVPLQIDIPAANTLIGGASFSGAKVFQTPLGSFVVAGMIGTVLSFSASPSGVTAGPEFAVNLAVADDLELSDVVEIQLSEIDWDVLVTGDAKAPTVNTTLLGFLTKPEVLDR
jgi:hypothetical protein